MINVKNVNIYPARQRKVLEINPPLIGPTYDLDLNTMIILRILKSGHKVEENLSNGKKVFLNVDNYELDNTIEKPITVTTISGNQDNSELIKRLEDTEKAYSELKEKYDELEKNGQVQVDEVVASLTDAFNIADKEKDEKIKALTEENEKLQEEIKIHEELAEDAAKTSTETVDKK